MDLESIVKRVDSFRVLIQEYKPSTEGLIRLVSQVRLDWGYDPDRASEEFNAGATKQILLKGLAHESHLLSKHSFDELNNRAFHELIKILRNDSELTKQNIIDLHKLIIADGGAFRLSNVITQSDFGTQIFVPFEAVEHEIDSLVEWYKAKKNDKNFHPLFLAAIFHHRLVSIHPFLDGNGRLARILTSIILLPHRIPPPQISKTDRAKYIESLRHADQGRVESWIQYLGELVIASMENMISQKR